MNMVYPQTVRYQGSVTTAIAKIFDLTAASTGLSENMLKKHNIEYQTVIVHPAAHATYYPGGSPIHLKLNFHPQNGMILGAQAVGTQNVDKQIDAISLIMSCCRDINRDIFCFFIVWLYGYSIGGSNFAGILSSHI